MRVVWFRSDLRVHDHPPLAAAIRSGEPVTARYAFDPRLRGPSESYGFERLGPFRARFLVEALTDLGERLAGLGIPLTVTAGAPEDAIPDGTTVVHFSGEGASQEAAAERAVVRRARAIGAKTDRHETFLLLHPDDLPYEPARAPDLFTTFRRDVERGGLRVREEAKDPGGGRGSWSFPADVRQAILPDDAPEPQFPDGRAMPGGETAALHRLEEWIWTKDRLRTYKETRNGMLRPDDSSHFSAYLAHGCLSPRRIFREVRRYERERVENDSTYWLIFELLWRDFFRVMLLKHEDRLFRRDGIQRLAVDWNRPDAKADAWREGRTGFPLVDAAMSELAATGYMSNRARQNVASFLTKNLGLDWRYGAEWFEHLLADYEPGANWGNWQYQAGVGNDGREFRLFNLRRQAEQYDPKGEFPRHWIPELRGLAGFRAYEPRNVDGYPSPIVDFDASARENRSRYERVAGRSERDERRPTRRR